MKNEKILSPKKAEKLKQKREKKQKSKAVKIQKIKEKNLKAKQSKLRLKLKKPSKHTSRIIWAAFFIVLIAFVWFLSIFGIGDKVPKLNDKLKYGLDINGGVYVLLEATADEDSGSMSDVMDQTKRVLENRVNAMGISEASVSIEGTNRIRVEMPGVKDASEAIEQIGKTAQLKFLLADGTEVMTGDAIKDAGFSTDSEHGGYKITMDFTSEGSKLFADATEKAASGKVKATVTDFTGNTVDPTSIVIKLDDEIISSPTVEKKIDSRSCEIFSGGGGFSQKQAANTSALIRGGALPASLQEVNSSVETATIGENALKLSVKAGIIGLGIVLLIMIFVYGLLGLIADLALMLYVMVVLWLMALMGSVLTLPGIAGIILSIGMAVDSNVIIFTRIREEISKGKSIRAAVDIGYHAALSTVIDSQTTTLIASIVLYLIGTTSVKGFALTLMIGTLVSIITAVFFTQLFVNVLAESKRFGKNKFFGMKNDGTQMLAIHPKIPFIKLRKLFYTFSILVMALGIGFTAVRGFNYGIDFTGGTTIQMELGKHVESSEIKSVISEFDLDPTIVYAGEEQTQVIIKTIKALESADRTKVINKISDEYGLKDDAVLASEEFGPTVGKDLKNNAVKSILIATICMLIYIRFRFKTWKYGVASILGLVHDVLITLSLYAIFGFTINNPFIAGILTVVGYSINDTIVVFDRIRENTQFFKKKEHVQLINSSVNQTLSRTFMTSLTTLVTMIPLYIMATDELRQFLIPLMIGVFVGTYSSVCLCSPLLYEFTKNDSISSYQGMLDSKTKSKQKSKENKGIVK